MLLEHAIFKWMVPYWRSKPPKSLWKTYKMMFWSQRLYRIITSEELVSPHHSAREMIEVVKNRDFTKLFQKSVRKQEKLVLNRKNLFNIVEQLQWKQRREERLSQQTSAHSDSDRSQEITAEIKRDLYRKQKQSTAEEERLLPDNNPQIATPPQPPPPLDPNLYFISADDVSVRSWSGSPSHSPRSVIKFNLDGTQSSSETRLNQLPNGSLTLIERKKAKEKQKAMEDEEKNPNLDCVSKEQIYKMWKVSERHLHKQLKAAMRDNDFLRQQLAIKEQIL